MGTAVDSEGRVLMLRRQKEPWLGLWSMPGGKMEVGEHPDAAMKREFREETGLDVEIERFCGALSELIPENSSHFVIYLFQVRVVGGELKESGEGPLQWMRPEEIKGVAIPSDEWMLEHMLLRKDGPLLATLDSDDTHVMIRSLHP